MAFNHTQNLNFLPQTAKQGPPVTFSPLHQPLSYSVVAAAFFLVLKTITHAVFSNAALPFPCHKFMFLQFIFRSVFKSHLLKEARLCYLKLGPSASTTKNHTFIVHLHCWNESP